MANHVADHEHPLPTNEAAEVVRRLNDEVINQDRLDLLDEVIDPAYVNHGPFPWGVVGREDLRRFYTVRALGFPDIHITIEDIATRGDVVAYRMTVAGTDTGEFLGIEPTGKSLQFSGFGWARVHNGRIVEHWGLVDELGILEQIGVKLDTIGRHTARRRRPPGKA